MEDLGDRLDAFVEQPERRGVRQHQTGGAVVDLGAQILEVEVAPVGRRDLLELEARHRDAGGVRSVRRVGRDDHVPAGLAAVGERGPHEHQARQLALRAGRGLERHRRQPRDLGEDLLELPHQGERALRALVLLERVQVAEARQPDDPLVDARVVLHRAAAERVEAGVDPEVPVGELREVAHDLVLGHLGQTWRRLPPQLGRQLGNGQPVRRDAPRAPARPRLLVDELHIAHEHTSASTSASRSTSAGVRLSVSATSRTSSSPG